MEFFELTSNCNYVFALSYPNTALTDIITAHSPGMTVWRKPYFSGAGYRVGPSRICVLIGIIWLNEQFFFTLFIKKKEKLQHNLAYSANFTHIFFLSSGLFSNSLFYNLATYFCISAHPLLIFLLLCF